MASIFFSRASFTVSSIYSKAAFPAIACILPISSSSISILFKSIKSIVPLMYFPFCGLSTTLIFKSKPQNFIALEITSLSPITIGLDILYTSSLFKAFTTISGPMPAGSPIGIPIIGLSILTTSS